MTHNLSPSDIRRRLRRQGKAIPAELEPAPVVREFFAGPSRLSSKRWTIVARVDDDGGRAVNELREIVGCWPYETAWMEAPGGASVLAHEGEAIAAALVMKGWVRL